VSPLADLAPGPISFRRANTNDRPQIEALQQAAYARNRRLLGLEPMPLQADYGEIIARMEVWLAIERERLAGVLILDPRQDDLLIWSVAAAPDVQGKGIGPILLDAAEVRARQLGRETVRLYTSEPLKTLIAWYQRHGYEVERFEDLADRRIVHLAKTLTEPGLS
jgi:ribosomal protein S18 acetylase RimI-like enzyme